MIESPEDFSALAAKVAELNGLDAALAAELVSNVGDSMETDPASGLVIARDDAGKEYRLKWPMEE